MAARAIGTSTISFGLVTIPVKLFATGESGARIAFNWIDKNSGTRVRQQYFNPDTGAVVPREDMVKGYEFAKNQYVLFEPDELKALEQPKTDAIEITEFVPAELVDRVFFDKAYYLGPDKGGGRAYRLLSAALGETDRVAIAKFATRGKQYLVMIRPYKDGLLLDQLRYASEVKSWDEVPVEDDEINEAELNLAVQLIEQAATDEFSPESYNDEVRERQVQLIQQKIEGEEISVAPAEEPQAQIIDLMAALKASITDSDEGGSGRKPAGRAAKKGAAKQTTKERTTKKAASG